MEVELTRVSEKGQIVIPSTLRKEMGINKSDQFIIFGGDNTIILKRIEKDEIKNTFEQIAKPLQDAAKQAGFSKEDLKKAIRDVRNAA
jgi:AbrB family looped-hinge helix DNA binding protein